MTHHFVTSKASLPFCYMYKCSKCGRVNLCEDTITGLGFGGETTRRSRVEALEKAADNQAKIGLTAKLKCTIDLLESGRYHTSNYKIKCQKCGNREAWCKYFPNPNRIIELLTGQPLLLIAIIASLFFTFIGMCICLFSGMFLEALCCFSYIAFYPILYGFLLGIHFIWNKAIQEKVEVLPLESHPIFLKFGSLND